MNIKNVMISISVGVSVFAVLLAWNPLRFFTTNNDLVVENKSDDSLRPWDLNEIPLEDDKAKRLLRAKVDAESFKEFCIQAAKLKSNPKAYEVMKRRIVAEMKRQGKEHLIEVFYEFDTKMDDLCENGKPKNDLRN